MILTKEQILDASDLPTMDVDVPEWGGTVRIGSMTAGDRNAIEEAFHAAKAKGRDIPANLRELIVSLCVVDASGQRMFSSADMAALSKKSAAAVSRIADAAMAFNRLSGEALEEARGNSEPDRSADS